ncbi:MAG: hypothetical protein NUW37_06195, partial [Planctomycetes bacterium]|nr:hypothetical protein [Planctomycetota bacterium]
MSEEDFHVGPDTIYRRIKSKRPFDHRSFTVPVGGLLLLPDGTLVEGGDRVENFDGGFYFSKREITLTFPCGGTSRDGKKVKGFVEIDFRFRWDDAMSIDAFSSAFPEEEHVTRDTVHRKLATLLPKYFREFVASRAADSLHKTDLRISLFEFLSEAAGKVRGKIGLDLVRVKQTNLIVVVTRIFRIDETEDDEDDELIESAREYWEEERKGRELSSNEVRTFFHALLSAGVIRDAANEPDSNRDDAPAVPAAKHIDTNFLAQTYAKSSKSLEATIQKVSEDTSFVLDQTLLAEFLSSPTVKKRDLRDIQVRDTFEKADPKQREEKPAQAQPLTILAGRDLLSITVAQRKVEALKVLEVPKSAGSDFTCIARGIESAGESYYIGTKR